jgi:hypothetical protein
MAVALFIPSMTAAQSFSGRGVDSRSMREVTCVAEIERLSVLVQALETRREEMITCNENGKVFAGVGEPGADADGCIDLDPLTASWDSLQNPTELHFEDFENTQVGSTITVTRGRDGDGAACPPDYREVN